MKNKVLAKELYIGMRVKCPVAGWWLRSNKKQVWYKGIVKQINGRSVIIYLTNRKGWEIGNMMFLGDQIKTDIYKVL